MSAAKELGERQRQQPPSERGLVIRLREPMGAVRLAVQILAGPLRGSLDQLDEVSRARVRSVLETLEASTQHVCELLSELPPTGLTAANGPPVVATPSPPPQPSRAPAPKPVSPSAIDVDELLRRLEIVTVTRSSLPVLLAVDAREGLEAADPGRELLPTLVGLVERAAQDSSRGRPHDRPWTVEVRAFIDPAEVLGEDMHVVIEVRHDGTALPLPTVAWLDGSGPPPVDEPALIAARGVAEAAGGRLEALSAGSKTAIRIRLPESAC